MKNQDFWVYILLCENNRLYTGYTNNLQKRYLSHLNGTGRCKFTRSFKPLAMARCWLIEGDKATAMAAERFIKQLSRQQKNTLIRSPSRLKKHCAATTVSKRKIQQLLTTTPHTD